MFSFPNYKTPSGTLLKKYLSSDVKLSDEALHLLFSANRYESLDLLNKLLDNNDYVICDRYCYSGIAYSIARGLDKTCCFQTDSLLLKKLSPDILIYLEDKFNSGFIRQDFIDQNQTLQTKIVLAYKEILPKNTLVFDYSKYVKTLKVSEISDTATDKFDQIMKRITLTKTLRSPKTN